MPRTIEVKKKKERFGIRLSKDFKTRKYVYFMAIPIVVYYLLFMYKPMIGLIIAFQDFKPFKGMLNSEWVGFEHFIDFLTGPFAWRTIRNTMLISIYGLLFGYSTPIIFALLINEVSLKSFKKTVQTISYLPHFISLVVVCGMITEFCLTDGVFNQIAVLLGGEAVSYLNEPQYFRTIYTTSSVWQVMGWYSIIYLATISSIDPNLYEAAYIDGAGRFQRMLHITLPALIPIIVIQWIMRLGHLLSVGFEKVILLYSPLIYETSDIISSYVYRRGLTNGEYSFGAAVGMFNSAVNVIVLIGANYFCKKLLKESLW